MNEWGDTLWTRRYGFGSCAEEARSVWPTTNGGFIVAGLTDHGTGNRDAWIIRINELGDTLWTRRYGGMNSEEAWSVQQTSDGGYVIGGWTEPYGGGAADIWLIRTNEIGDTLWTRTFGGPEWDEARFAQQTFDGGFIIVGTTESFGVRKLNENFNTQSRQLETSLPQNNYLTGQAEYWFNQNYDLKIDLDKGKQNNRTECARQFLRADPCYASQYLKTTELPYSSNVWLIRTDAFGDTLWTRTYGDSGYQLAHVVRQTSEGGFIVAGTTEPNGSGNSDLWLIRTDNYGDTLWTATFDHDLIDVAYDCRQISDGGFIVTGKSGYEADFNTFSDVWLLRLAPEISSRQSEIKQIPKNFSLEQNYPNPFNPSTTISYHLPRRSEVILRVYNLLGQDVRTLVNTIQGAGEHQVVWDGKDRFDRTVSSGVYIYTLQAEKYFSSRKMLFLK